jgi:hypothetical protein
MISTNVIFSNILYNNLTLRCVITILCSFQNMCYYCTSLSSDTLSEYLPQQLPQAFDVVVNFISFLASHTLDYYIHSFITEKKNMETMTA